MEPTTENRPDPRVFAQNLTAEKWESYNARRLQLIDKQSEGALGGQEQRELVWLQATAEHYLSRVAPMSLNVVTQALSSLKLTN